MYHRRHRPHRRSRRYADHVDFRPDHRAKRDPGFRFRSRCAAILKRYSFRREQKR